MLIHSICLIKPSTTKEGGGVVLIPSIGKMLFFLQTKLWYSANFFSSIGGSSGKKSMWKFKFFKITKNVK